MATKQDLEQRVRLADESRKLAVEKAAYEAEKAAYAQINEALKASQHAASPRVHEILSLVDGLLARKFSDETIAEVVKALLEQPPTEKKS